MGLVLTLALSSCATLSETECTSGNWEQIGYQDGKAGRDSDYILNHESACIEYGININRMDYEDGRQRGLALYCNANNGYQRGSDGNAPNSTCSSGQYPRYYDSYYDGLSDRYESLEIELDEAYREHEILQEVLRRVDNEEEKERISQELGDIDSEIESLDRQKARVDELIRRYRPQ